MEESKPVITVSENISVRSFHGEAQKKRSVNTNPNRKLPSAANTAAKILNAFPIVGECKFAVASR